MFTMPDEVPMLVPVAAVLPDPGAPFCAGRPPVVGLNWLALPLVAVPVPAVVLPAAGPAAAVPALLEPVVVPTRCAMAGSAAASATQSRVALSALLLLMMVDDFTVLTPGA